MLVKKFEAKTMKEALSLVKKELGPEAIIMSVKDLSRAHGIVGGRSVQVTAAVSEKVLAKKKLVEESLNEDLKNRFNATSAENQKKFIKEFIEEKKKNIQRQKVSRSQRQSKSYQMTDSEGERPVQKSKVVRSESRSKVSSRRYIDIEDDPISQRSVVRGNSGSLYRNQQIQAVENEINRESEVLNVDGKLVNRNYPAKEKSVPLPRQEKRYSRESQEVEMLKKQISQLQQLIENFQTVPQNLVSMHPGARDGLPYELSGMFNKLARLGFLEESIVEILKEAQLKLSTKQIKNPSLLDAWVAQYLMTKIMIVNRPFDQKVNIFIGGSGQGKTSTVIKAAAYLALEKKKKIALVTTDVDKVGAVEQFKIYSQILNIPFAAVRSPDDWMSLQKNFQGLDNILIDTGSCKINDHNGISKLNSLLPKKDNQTRVHYVQSLLSRREDAFDCAQTFLGVGFDDIIYTHVDESRQYGLIYNFQERFQVPIHSFGIGPRVPEDQELATKERYVDLIFNLSSSKKRSSR